MAGVRSSKTVGSTKYDFTTLSGLVTRQTGGGKTMTSFKAAQLIAANHDAEKVIFLVDRKELE